MILCSIALLCEQPMWLPSLSIQWSGEGKSSHRDTEVHEMPSALAPKADTTAMLLCITTKQHSAASRTPFIFCLHQQYHTHPTSMPICMKIKNQSVTNPGEGEQCTCLLRTTQSNTSLDKSHIYREVATGRLKVAAGERWRDVMLHVIKASCCWHRFRIVTLHMRLWAAMAYAACPKQVPKTPISHRASPGISFIASTLVVQQCKWQNPSALSDGNTVAGWHKCSMGPNWEKLDLGQVRKRQLSVAGAVFKCYVRHALAEPSMDDV